MMLAALNRWFTSRSPRQQGWLALCVAVLMVLLAGLLLVPLHGALAELRAAHASEAATLREVRELVAANASLAEREDLRGGAEPLIARVNQSLERQGFQPQRIQQGQQGELQLRVEDVEFEALLAWLNLLEQTPGVLLEALSLGQAESGRVNANLTLRSL